MHDKYAYERIEMALHDYAPLRTMAFGIAGMSVVADSLSAIKYAKVKVKRDETGLITDYETEGEFPLFGNNDNRVDGMASLAGHAPSWASCANIPTYRNALHTQSVLTITSNVVYGKATGNTPDGRGKGEPFAPGANPMHGRDSHGIHASAASVAKIPYRDAADGISLTTTLVPSGLGRTEDDRITNLTSILDGFFGVDRLSHEHQRAEPRDADRRDGSSGKISEPDDPGVGLCGQLRAPDPRAANGRDQPHVPRRLTWMARRASQAVSLEAKSPYRDARPSRRGRAGHGRPHARSRPATWASCISFTTGSAVDGPGIRLVAWTTACMFRCQYCHNPDTWTLEQRHPGARSNGRSTRFANMRNGLKAMNGGFTLSGGEPLMQDRFAVRLFAAVKAMGVHTAIETNGYLRRPAVGRGAAGSSTSSSST